MFIALSQGIFGQELLMPELPEKDSVDLAIEREILYRQLLSGKLISADLISPLPGPEWNFNLGLVKQWSFDTYDRTFNSFQWKGFKSDFLEMPSPFLVTGSVFSSAAWQLNNRFMVGGYSFGAKSVFTSPFPNQGINSYDVRGSTLFLKYNVSKNFRIETRINVTQGPGPGF